MVGKCGWTVKGKKSLTGWANERIVIVKEGERKSRTPQPRERPAERRSPCPRPPSPASPPSSSPSPTSTTPRSARCCRRCSTASPSRASPLSPRLVCRTRTSPRGCTRTRPRPSPPRTWWTSVTPTSLPLRRLPLCCVSRSSAVCSRRSPRVRRWTTASCTSLARVSGVP